MKSNGELSSGKEFPILTTGKLKRFNLTGSAALSGVLAPSSAWQLEEVRIHLSAAGAAGNFTVTSGNFTGAVYNTLLFSQDMTSVTDLRWRPEGMTFKRGDSLSFAWANGSTRTFGLEAVWKEI